MLSRAMGGIQNDQDLDGEVLRSADGHDQLQLKINNHH
jgi:hypothetical protein